MHIMNNDRKEIEVMVIPVDHSPEIARMEQWLAKIETKDPFYAGYDEQGCFHACQDPDCRNMRDDGNEICPDSCCAQEEYCRLEARRDRLLHQQPLLQFYWRTKGKTDVQEFLRQSDLVSSYLYAFSAIYAQGSRVHTNLH